MTRATAVELLEHALQLPADDRLAMATELLGSVEGPEDPEWAAVWAAELDRRVREVEEGKVETIPWSQVKEQLEQRLRSK